MAGLRLELFPHDLDRFVDFWTRVLRFEVVQREREYVYLRRGEARIGAVPAWMPVEPARRAVPQGAEIVIEVEDVRAERDRVVAAGWPLAADVEEQPWGLTDFRLFDPDGYYVRVTSLPPA